MTHENNPRQTTTTTDKLTQILLTNQQFKNKGLVCRMTGRWGTGKTQAWYDFVKVNTPRYWNPFTWGYSNRFIYISLFNQQSIDAINARITQELPLNFNTLGRRGTISVITAVVLGFAIHWLAGVLLGLLYFFKHKWFSNMSLLGLSISPSTEMDIKNPKAFKNVVICFDDFERLPSSISIEEVLGLISQLREAKQCRVLILLTDEDLTYFKGSSNNSTRVNVHKALLRYDDKVIDRSIVHTPTPSESYQVALKYVGKEVREYAESLSRYQSGETMPLEYFCYHEITNIRIMVRVLNTLYDFRAILNVLNKAIEVQDFFIYRVIAITTTHILYGDEAIEEILYVWEHFIPDESRDYKHPGEYQEEHPLYHEDDYRVEAPQKDINRITIKRQSEFKLLSSGIGREYSRGIGYYYEGRVETERLILLFVKDTLGSKIGASQFTSLPYYKTLLEYAEKGNNPLSR